MTLAKGDGMGERPATFPIKPGYVFEENAKRRALETWASDAMSHLVGLLLSGELRSWALNSSGEMTELAADAYQSEALRGSLNFTQNIYSGTPSPSLKFRIIFLEEDLDRVLPFQLQIIARQVASRRARQQESAKKVAVDGAKGSTASEALAETPPASAGPRAIACDAIVSRSGKKREDLPPLRQRILDVADRLWPDGKFPVRVGDREQAILDAWRPEVDGKAKPCSKTIQRAFDDWTKLDK